MRIAYVLMALALAACSEAGEITVKRKATPTPDAATTAASLADRLKSLLASRNLPQMIHDAAEPVYRAASAAYASMPLVDRPSPCQGDADNRRACEKNKDRARDAAAVLDGARLVKERLNTEAKARGDGDEQFLAYVSLQIDATVPKVSAAGDWVSPEATPTPAPTPDPNRLPYDVNSVIIGRARINPGGDAPAGPTRFTLCVYPSLADQAVHLGSNISYTYEASCGPRKSCADWNVESPYKGTASYCAGMGFATDSFSVTITSATISYVPLLFSGGSPTYTDVATCSGAICP